MPRSKQRVTTPKYSRRQANATQRFLGYLNPFHNLEHASHVSTMSAVVCESPITDRYIAPNININVDGQSATPTGWLEPMGRFTVRNWKYYYQ
jgi:hypothetical protein